MTEVDREPSKLAAASVDFVDRYEVDFLKTMNNGMYSIEDYGAHIDYSDVPHGGVAKVEKAPVQEVADWKHITEKSLDTGALSRELEGLELTLQQLDDSVPVVMTVFSPLTTAEKLSQGLILDHLEDPRTHDVVHQALSLIAKTTAELAGRALELGASGVFLACQSASYQTFGKNYAEFGEPYDLKVLEGAKAGWLNIVHSHGEDILYDSLKDYPVAAFNWHAGESLPTIEEATDLTPRAICGGLDRRDVQDGHRNGIRNQIHRALRATGGSGLLLTPGCVIRQPLDPEMLSYIRRSCFEVDAALTSNRPEQGATI